MSGAVVPTAATALGALPVNAAILTPERLDGVPAGPTMYPATHRPRRRSVRPRQGRADIGRYLGERPTSSAPGPLGPAAEARRA